MPSPEEVIGTRDISAELSSMLIDQNKLIYPVRVPVAASRILDDYDAAVCKKGLDSIRACDLRCAVPEVI